MTQKGVTCALCHVLSRATQTHDEPKERKLKLHLSKVINPVTWPLRFQHAEAPAREKGTASSQRRRKANDLLIHRDANAAVIDQDGTSGRWSPRHRKSRMILREGLPIRPLHAEAVTRAIHGSPRMRGLWPSSRLLRCRQDSPPRSAIQTSRSGSSAGRTKMAGS